LNFRSQTAKIPQMAKAERKVPEEKEFRIHVPPCSPFYFDPGRMLFVVGCGEHQKRYYPQTVDSLLSMEWEIADYETRIGYLAEEYLVLGRGELIEMGFLRKKLSEIFDDERKRGEVRQIVILVMRKVYKQIEPAVTLPKRDGGRPISFDFGFKKSGVFSLETFGNCACLGRDPSEDLPCTVDNMEGDISLPLVYSTHNADTQAKLISLYAGAGTLAFLARRDFKDLEALKIGIQQGLAKRAPSEFQRRLLQM